MHILYGINDFFKLFIPYLYLWNIDGDEIMDKNDLLLKIYGVSGILGFLSEIFTSIQTSYIILLVLIILDTLAGIVTAIKYKRFSSTGLRKATRKIISYTLCIITVKLLETILNPLITTTMLSQSIIAFLAITESVSILENFTLLGVPIPSNFLPLLIRAIKIPGLNILKEHFKPKEKGFSDIDDILNYQVPTFDDKYMRTFLEIKYDLWRSIINQIMLIDDATTDSDILYYKILSFLELALKDMDRKWSEEKIPVKYLKNFTANNQAKIDKCLKKIKTICYNENTTKDKKDQIIDCIILILYQTIIDARKSI